MKVIAVDTEGPSYKIVAANGSFLNETTRSFTFSTLAAAQESMRSMNNPESFAIVVIYVVA